MRQYLLDLLKQPRPIQDGEAVRLEYREILAAAHQEEPLPVVQENKKGRPKQSKGRNLMNRFVEHEDAILAPAKVKFKVSGCFRTQGDGRTYARLQGIISTLRKQGEGVFDVLRDMMRGQPAAITTG